MLAHDTINQIAKEVARANLSRSTVTEVMSEPAVDSEGHDMLRITIVIEPEAVASLQGDALLDTLVQMQDRLRAAGEERFAILEYATKEELEQVDHPES